MNATPLRCLLWKEYRAIRAFWIALVLLALGLQALMLLTSSDQALTQLFVYNVALATPVFFALGCVGTTFAMEKEDGTYEWLQASPVNDRQVLVSKLVLATLATVGMYFVLLPLALWIEGAELPAADTLRGMLGLWLLAAVEAIAWATLFSLLSARPLTAIVLAMVVTSSLTHLMAWTVTPGRTYHFHFAPYLTAVPWRLAVILPVMLADVYLGLRWLHGEQQSPAMKRPSSLQQRLRAFYMRLRAWPATPTQTVVNNLVLLTLIVVASYTLLWPLTLWLNNPPVEISGRLSRDVVGLLLLSIVEASAWTAFFYFLSRRPWGSIALGLVTASVVTRGLIWLMPGTRTYSAYALYHQNVIPWRLLLLLVLIAVDIYLGSGWWHDRHWASTLRGGLLARTRDQKSNALLPYLQWRDRGMILGHLLWQHWRQSLRLMLLMSTLQIAMSMLVMYSGADKDNTLAILPLLGMAAVMGACVFLPDQERRHFRFFVEHNVSPRYVWLTRLVPWMVIAAASSFIVMLFWIGIRTLGKLVWAMLTMFQVFTTLDNGNRVEINAYYTLPPIFLGVAGALLAFTIGQWVSMMVRSGLLAGFFSLLLAGTLGCWTLAVYSMSLSWLMFIAPIPLVLLWATWLRAPDWIVENATWRARLKAGSTVVVPTLALLVAAPFAHRTSSGCVSRFLSRRICCRDYSRGVGNRRIISASERIEHTFRPRAARTTATGTISITRPEEASGRE